jgi:hypothetical protein
MENRPWLFPVIPSLHNETLLHTARRSTGESPQEYRFTLETLMNFLQSNFNVVRIEGSYTNDATAASGGVAIGEYYELASGNYYGLPAGILKKRVA